MFWRRQGDGVGNPEGVAGVKGKGMQRSHSMGQGEMGIGILGRRKMTLRWANYPVLMHDRVYGRVARGGCVHPPPSRKIGGGWRRSEWVKKSRVSYVTINN